MKQPERKRILFIGEAIALSHVARPAVLAQALDPEKYRVTLACDPRFNQLFGDSSVDFIPIRSISAASVRQRVYYGDPIFDQKTLDNYVREEMRLFRALAPDLVVGDFRQSLAVSSKLAAIPYVNIVDAYWSPYARVDFELAAHPLIEILGEPLAQLIFKAARPLGFAYHTLPLNLVRMKYSLPGLGFDAKQIYCYGDYTIYPNVAEIVPTYNLPPNHLYLGPILWSPNVRQPDWWNDVANDKPVVYVTLGSSGQPALLKVILQALAELPVTVMVATASRGNLDTIPANVYLADYLPGFEAAQRSQLVICNGGSMSGQQSLAAGVPMLGLVSNIDQLVFAKSIKRAGAGDMVREGKVTLSLIKTIISKMLSQNSYQKAAQKIARLYQKTNAAETFRNLVDGLFLEHQL